MANGNPYGSSFSGEAAAKRPLLEHWRRPRVVRCYCNRRPKGLRCCCNRRPGGPPVTVREEAAKGGLSSQQTATTPLGLAASPWPVIWGGGCSFTVALSTRAMDLYGFHRGKTVNMNITSPYQTSWLFTIRKLNSRHDLKTQYITLNRIVIIKKKTP
jgi:hypothetical protein